MRIVRRLIGRVVRLVARAVVAVVVLGVALALVLPYVVPFTSTGTLTHRGAADAWVADGGGWSHGPGGGSEAGSDGSGGSDGATFVEVLGIELHVERLPAGAGATDGAADGAAESAPLVVLLHGFGGSTATWRDTAPALAAAGAEVVAYDRPAFGFTERILDDALDAFRARTGVDLYGPDGQVALLDALIDTLLDADGSGADASRPVVLVGHSAGGTLAAEYALRRPERLAGVVLVAPAILTTGGAPGWVRPVLAFPPVARGGPFVARLAARGSDRLLDASWHDPTRVTDAMRAEYAAPQAVLDWERGLWELVRAPGALAVAERPGDVAVPVLLVTGDDDRVVPTDDTRELAGLIAGAELVVLERVGHIPQEEDAAGTLDAVRGFLARVAGVGGGG